jgi:hypothetical protein
MRATCLLLASVVLTWSLPNAQAQPTDAGPDTSLCVNYYTMQGSPLPVGATGFWALVSGCGTIVNAGSPTTDLNSLCIGTNVFVWYVDDNGTITTDQVAITVYDASMAVADAGPDTITVVAPQNSAFLSGSPTPIAPAVCFWTVVAGTCSISEPSNPNTIVYGSGTNVLQWICDNGPCGVSTDQVTIQMMLSTGLEDTNTTQPNGFAYNPTMRELHVLNGTTVNAFEVFDGRGRCISRTNAGVRTVSMVDQPEGFYVARATVDDRTVVQRFVIGY